MEQTKLCGRCKLEKSLDLFYKDATKKDGLTTTCKECKKFIQNLNPDKKKAYAKDYYWQHLDQIKEKRETQKLKDPEKFRDVRKNWNLKKMHGITLFEFQRLLSEQNGCCAICGTPEILSQTLCVDHDHQTGTIRALLCTKCNKGLGLFNDDTVLLSRAVDYLKAHTSKELE